MKYTAYDSIEDMIQPETLSRLLQHPIATTRLAPFETAGWSATGSDFLGVFIDGEQQPSLVVKRMSMEWDWLMCNTDDVLGRSVTAWQYGFLDRMPPEIDTTVIACARDGAGQAIMMHNVTESLLPSQTKLSESDNAVILDAMAALHATFWKDTALQDSALGLCSLANFITHSSPEKGQRLLGRLPNTEVVNMMIEGWRLVSSFVEPDVADLLLALVHDPSRLTTALAAYPHTLVHGDLRIANIGVVPSQPAHVIFLDMARLAFTTPAIDLAYYLVTSFDALPIPPEAVIDLYKQRLARRLGARFDETWWQPQLELCLLAGSLTIMCFSTWFTARSDDVNDRLQTQAEFNWWSEQIRRGAKWLPH
jgi:hypothetical protein